MDNAKPLTCLGAISGTSMDAIDVAVLKTDGRQVVEFIGEGNMSYPVGLREQLLTVAADPKQALAVEPGGKLDQDVARSFAKAIGECLSMLGLERGDIDLVGCHGQTVWHDPAQRVTRQLADCAWLATELGLPVIGDFRQADVAAGGQGAPLAPLYHAALVADKELPVAILNLGGVGNVTYVGEDTLLAFDTGPANALIDDFVKQRLDKDYDADGGLAATGEVNEDIVSEFRQDPYFSVKPPKSLDRFHFHKWLDKVAGMDDAGGAATLLALTVASIVEALSHLPTAPMTWYVTGGGSSNAHMMRSLARALQATVEPVEALGARSASMEAEAFAYLAARSAVGLPLSLPTTTGAPKEMLGGERYEP